MTSTPAANDVCRKALRTALLALPALCVALPARADWSLLNMTRGVTPISETAYDLHMLILWICVAIGVVVFGAMFYSIIVHRKSRGAVPANFHHSTKAEILWTVVPCVILVAMAIPATKGLVAMEDTSNSDITIKVTGYQWKWHYEYVGSEVNFYSDLAPASRGAIHGDPSQVENYLLDVDNPLVIPQGKKVRLLLTSNDVIHAWWIPEFGMKKDAIPGFINEMWVRVDQPGTYRGQCAELCGKDHGFMPIVAVVKPQAEYDAWLAARAAETATARSGETPDVTLASATQTR
jgi:cytochrome c oxidase subunit 2